MLNGIDRPLPIDLVLEMAEEIKRSGRAIPNASFLQRWSKNRLQKQYIMLIASLDMRDEFEKIVKDAPPGGELFERIRKRSLNE